MHFDRSWFVFGEPVSLIDIWQGPNGLIAIEQFIKEQLELETSDLDIKKNCIKRFQNSINETQIERYADSLLHAQSYLKVVQAKIKERQEILDWIV